MPTPCTDVLEAQCYHGTAAVCRSNEPWNLGRVAVYTYPENSLASHQSSQSPTNQPAARSSSLNVFGSACKRRLSMHSLGPQFVSPPPPVCSFRAGSIRKEASRRSSGLLMVAARLLLLTAEMSAGTPHNTGHPPDPRAVGFMSREEPAILGPLSSGSRTSPSAH